MPLRMSQMLRSSRDLRGRAAAAVGPAQRVAPHPGRAGNGSDPVPQVEIDPLIEEAPAAPAAVEAVEPVEPVESQDTSPATYRQLVEAAEEVFAAAGDGRALDGGPIVAAIRIVVAELRESNALLAETVRQRRDARAWPRRSANVAILAMKLGLEIGYDERRTLALGLCGLMHDVGMLSLDGAMLDSEQFTQEQRVLLQQHPVESQRMVCSFGKAFEWIASVIVQVHERHDGTGYPRGLGGEEIHEFARIIGLVDSYEAMAQPRADREARVVYNALKRIIDLRTSLYDRRLVKAFIHIVSIFPLGSLVKLNNGEIGRVVGTSKSHPTRPTVDVLMDSHSCRLPEPRLIRLEDEPMLYVVDPAIEEGVLGKDR